MSYPIRLALAVLASLATVAGGAAPAPVPAAADIQVPAVTLAHATVEDSAADQVDVDGAATARTTQLSAQADQISKAAADLQAAKQAQAAADLQAAKQVQAAAAAKTASASKSAVTSTPVVVVAPGSARDIARQMMLSIYGWGDDQFTCFDKIITQESGWNVSATNRSSGAYGIPQALPGSKMATAGADWQTNPATQIKWALGYVQGRYSTPCGAWSFKSAHGWY
jgi:hypothetical protein